LQKVHKTITYNEKLLRITKAAINITALTRTSEKAYIHLHSMSHRVHQDPIYK